MPVTRIRLSSVAMTAVGLSPRPINIFNSNHTPFITVVHSLYYFPLTWRKLLLDACRVQVPVKQNSSLSETLFHIHPRQIVIPSAHGDPLHFDIDYILALVEQFISTPILCSMLSYFCRAESTYHRDEFLEQRMIGFDKEITAALFYEPKEHVLNYQGLFGINWMNVHPQLQVEIPRRLVHLFGQGIERIKKRFSTYKQIPILPAYNRKKNVSRSTVIEYWQSVRGEDSYLPTRHDYSLTSTWTLLRHYYLTGNRIGGVLEVRLAWFFNDLKPRIYYCLGGEAFWAGIYIQHIANILVEILPSTDPFTRFTVTRIPHVSDQHVLITYDYSSFTTSLDELHDFIFWLARLLEGVPVSVLDVRAGIRVLDLGHLLSEYNEMVNQYQCFSVERFSELVGDRVIYNQGRNGSLGTKGNIVLSTFLHGISLGSASGTPDTDCCVGDDALTAILETFISAFITCTNNLGDVNPSKFRVIKRPTAEFPDPSTQQFKFLKRPLNLSAAGLPYLGILDFFPSVADALFPDGDGIHSSGNIERNFVDGIKTFCMQWGRFLRIQKPSTSTDVVNDDELEFLLGSILAVYIRYGLPLEGAPPGGFYVELPDGQGRTGLDIMIPPCEWLVFERPWELILLDRFRGHVFTQPVTMGGAIHPPIDVSDGDRFRCTGSPLVTLLEDLGCIQSDVITEDVEFDDGFYEAYLSRVRDDSWHLPDGETFMYKSVIVLEKPHWWMSVMLPYHESVLQSDPFEGMSRISSLFGSERI